MGFSSKFYCNLIILLLNSIVTVWCLQGNYFYNQPQGQQTYYPAYSSATSSFQNFQHAIPTTVGSETGGFPYYFNSQIPTRTDQFLVNGANMSGDKNKGLLPKQETEGHAAAGGNEPPYGPSMESHHHEEHPMMTEMMRLGPDGILKILLTVLPVVLCLIFVPSLVVTIGLLLIPVFQWDDLVNRVGR